MNSQKSLQSSVFLIAICLAFVAVQLDISIVNVGLESLKQAYNANITDLEWIINAYPLFFAAFLLSTGALSNRYGVKNIFIIGIVIFITASLSCALATSLLWLNISRCIQGIGPALMVPSSMTLIQLYYPNQRQRAFALLLFMTPNWGIYQLFIPMMLLGGGTSLAMPGMANLIFSQASKEGASSASALFSCARQMGGVIGVGIFGLMITNNSLFNGVKLVVISAMLFTAIWLVVSVFKLTNSK